MDILALLKGGWQFFIQNKLFSIGMVLGLYLGWKMFWLIFRYIFTIKATKNIVYFKISLPRQDSQKDREKAVEKDFREKIAVMAQLYRSIYEIKEMNIWNTLHSKIFKLDVVSFDIVSHKKLIDFYVVTYKRYKLLIEKQITSYYPTADIQVVEPYEIQPKGHHLKSYYLYQKNPFWYPIKTYKVIENDPLNSLTNVMSKLEEDERAVLQLTIRPRFGKWQKRAKEVGNALMLKKKVKNQLNPKNQLVSQGKK